MPRCVGQGSAGEAILEDIVSPLGIASAAVQERQNRLCRHWFRPQPVRPPVAGCRNVGGQRRKAWAGFPTSAGSSPPSRPSDPDSFLRRAT